MKITVETTVGAGIEDVWRAYTTPDDIVRWNTASDSWHTTRATVDLRPGGAFSSRMEAKDGSMGFDFAGTYTAIEEHRRIAYDFGDRHAEVDFLPAPHGVVVRVTFDAETTHSIEQQRAGWQAILDSFARHVHALAESAGKTVVDLAAPTEFVARRRFAAPASAVFAAWSDPQLFRQWWVPAAFGPSLLSCDMDVRTGGRYRLVFRHPNSEEPTAFFGTYVEVVPGQRLVWTNEEGGDGPVTAVGFTEADGVTTVELRDRYPSPEARDAAIAAGSTSGFAEQFDQLDRLLAGGAAHGEGMAVRG